MSIVSIAGCLILQGDLTCDGKVTVESSGIVIPVPNELTETVFSCPIQDFLSSNGKSPTITSTEDDIRISGIINGDGHGFPPNAGPGANSTLLDNHSNPIPFYGATHAGLGYVKDIPSTINQYEEEFTLTSLQADQKFIVLTYYPIEPENVVMNVIRGSSQQYYTDFYITGNILQWRTPSLEPFLGEGDRIRVIYMGDIGRIMPPPRPVYGTREAPLSIGSGSGETAGGSGIRLVARSGEVYIPGTITMDGESGISPRSGGASGGSIWVIAYDITGAGNLSVDGGDASYDYAGGGAGGYITLSYENSNTFSGTFSAIGRRGAVDGVVFTNKIEAFFLEKFTGKILNSKWWEIVRDPTYVQNQVVMDTSTADPRDPMLQSKFGISGKNIQVDLDFIPGGSEPSYHTSYFRICKDDENWVGVARKYRNIFGMYSLNGAVYQTALPYPYIPTRFRVSKTDSTFTMQFVDSSAGPQTIMSESIPSLETTKFSVRMGTDKDPSDQTLSHLVEYFSLTDNDVANKYVTLMGLPIDQSNVAMTLLNATPQQYGIDYYISGQYLKWDSSSLPLYDSTAVYSDTIVLTTDQVYSKNAQLSAVPVISTLHVSVVGLGDQTYGVDYLAVNDHLYWSGKALDGILAVDSTITADYTWSAYNETPLDGWLQEGDQMVVQYDATAVPNDLLVSWDNFRVYNGILHDTETPEPVVYVDSVHGSDSSDGLALTPLQNLFVATAWAKRGGTVVLYDGSHNPTEVIGKNLTVMGADGAHARIITADVLDSTGSNWENAALTFRDCQGLVKNITLSGTNYGLHAENTDGFEVRECTIADSTSGIRFDRYNTGTRVLRNTIRGVGQAIVLSGTERNPYIYSNVVYNASVAVVMSDASNYVISSNTFDGLSTGIVMDMTSCGFIASNNITGMLTGILMDTDSSAYIENNNFFGTSAEYTGGHVLNYFGNIWVNPLYKDSAVGNYRLESGSPNRDAGTDGYDTFYLDRDGATRPPGANYDIGAYEVFDGTHGTGQWYVSSTGDDYRNQGSEYSPFRTLDRAMISADTTVNIDGGFYDSYYLRLKEQNINLNTLFVVTVSMDQVVSFVTLTAADASNKYVSIPGFAASESLDDLNRVMLNIVRGPTQEMGVDYTVGYGYVLWGGYPLENFLAAGDTLRLIYPLKTKAGNMASVNSYFSDIDLGNMLFVSPNGSDSSVWTGDGTHSGGDGSLLHPFRTVTKALQDSSVGTNVVVFSGEYEVFGGKDGRVIVPFADRTGVPDGRQYLQSLYESPARMYTNHNINDPIWTTYSSGDSTAFIQEGFLSMSFDGTNACGADSTFSFTPAFTAHAELRQGIDPVYFILHNKDTTVGLEYNDGDWTSTIVNSWGAHSYWGSLPVQSAEETALFTDYLCISSQDVTDKYVRTTFLIEDASNVTVNIVGGDPQHMGADFRVEDGMIKWDGMGLDGEIGAGDVVRAIYKAKGLSDTGVFEYSISSDGVLHLRAFAGGEWMPLMRERIYSDTTSAWTASFCMDVASAISHENVNGRGYASRFFVIAESIAGTDKAVPYKYKTWRQPIVMYNQDTGNP